MSTSTKLKDELRIFTPIGQLGQGFNENIFWDTVESGCDAVICDGVSTNSGPGRLALGLLNVPYFRLAKDLELLAKAAHLYNVPLLIGSIAGDGENAHVDMAAEIVTEAVKRNGMLYDRSSMTDGLISPYGGGVSEINENDIDSSTRVVAQIGLEPYLKAVRENPEFGIIVGGRACDPAPYAAFCIFVASKTLELPIPEGKIMEYGAQCSIPKSREALAIIRHDSFDMIHLEPKSKFSTLSVASFSLFLDERSVRVANPKFVTEPEGKYTSTVKLEGAKANGYHTIFLGAVRDPILIQHFDSWIGTYVKERILAFGYEYDLKNKYGINGVMGPLEPEASVGMEVSIAGQARAATQDRADQVASMAKYGLTHAPYAGQLATAGKRSAGVAFHTLRDPDGSMPGVLCVPHRTQG
ncbi:hypothetical protein LTR72_008157 [Exophiala xenobiotica]|nr:hypothetical protein LTR41_009096 [Exophiala xenobiotica]KAK5218975.1 hypothetical protein LTR72_008157 [Exophiala xenobiotica]KAK5291308.1 hypothetical protein LTR14_005882 [Exophiala xenobiotica]